MRPLAIGGLAACLVLIGSACGSQPAPRILRANLASSPAPRELTPAPATTTTAAPTTTTTSPRPVDRPRRIRSVSVQAPTAVGPISGDCLHGWSAVIGAARTARAHACWDGLLAQYPWNTSKAFAVMMCESGGDPYNVGPVTRYGTAKGLMQVLPDGSFDPATNMAQAWDKYKTRGWQPWTCA